MCSSEFVSFHYLTVGANLSVFPLGILCMCLRILKISFCLGRWPCVSLDYIHPKGCEALSSEWVGMVSFFLKTAIILDFTI